MATTGSELLSMIQTSARNGTLLPSCAPEIKELMTQIDGLISSRQREWESSLRALQTQVQTRDRDIAALKLQVRERNAQVEHLRQESSALQREYKTRYTDYEGQLDRLRSEVSRLNKAYGHLRVKRTSRARDSEVTRLSSLMEELERCRDKNKALCAQVKETSLVKTENKELRESVEVLRETVQSKDELIRTLQEEISFAQSSAHVSSCQADLCQAQDKLKSQLTLEKALREELTKLKENRESWEGHHSHRVGDTCQCGVSCPAHQFIDHVDKLEHGEAVDGSTRDITDRLDRELEHILEKHFTQLDSSIQNLFTTQSSPVNHNVQ